VKITQISLNNFRQHRNVRIELDDSHSSFTIIKARNGAGKTNLLKAITWVLTGKLAKDESKFDPISLVSISASNEASKGEVLEVSVKLDLSLGDGKYAQVERSARFIKSGTGTQNLSLSTTELTVVLLEDKAKGWQKESNAELWIEKNFPERFSHYFLFDGEHLHRFFKDTEAEFVKRAVLEIANIDQLEKIVEHLKTVSQSLVKEAGSVAGVKGEELRKLYEMFEEKILSLEKELATKCESRIELDENLAAASEKLGDIQAIKKDIANRNQLEIRAQAASDRGMDAKKELYSWAFKTGPGLMLQQELIRLNDEINKARINKVLPPPFKPEALQELLDKNECICGRGLDKQSDACNHVLGLLEKFTDLSEIGTILNDLQGPLQGVKSKIDNSSDMLRSTQERILIAKDDESKAMEELGIIIRKLANSDDAHISFIAKTHEDTKRDLERTILSIGGLEQQLIQTKERLSDVQRDIENEAATKERSRIALQRQKFAAQTLETAEQMYEDFSNQVRAKVAKDLDAEFQAMVWKKDFFQPVQIDSDYKVLVFNKLGVEIRNMLSAGETACLAFAFSLTLSEVAGFSYPMVVDSPLGRLDAEVKEFVSGVLAKALESDPDSEGKQILMLMTDSEYNLDVADALAHMNPKVLEIVFDQDVSESRLVNIS
jgi:DNA sulfur modification protein DndD